LVIDQKFLIAISNTARRCKNEQSLFSGTQKELSRIYAEKNDLVHGNVSINPVAEMSIQQYFKRQISSYNRDLEECEKATRHH
jgi:hypothetical protein